MDISQDIKVVKKEKKQKLLKMCIKMDVSQDNTDKYPVKYKKQTISLSIKDRIWKQYFDKSLYGNCLYCNNYILIPKTVFEKLYPKQNIDDYDSYIPTYIIGTHFDHIQSEYNLGKTDCNNIQPICSICNLKKNNKNSDVFVQSKSFTDNSEYNNDFMDIDLNINQCKGIILDKNKNGRKCNNNSYFRDKCVCHMYQNITY